MKKIMIIVNTLKHNRGTEALVRGTVKSLKNIEKDSYIYVVANDFDIEKIAPVPGVDENIRKSNITKKNYFQAAVYVFLKKICKQKELAAKFRYRKMLSIAKCCDLILCVGADNFDCHYGMLENLKELHNILREECTQSKLILYDCSIGNDDFNDAVRQECSNFKWITAREEITFNNLNKLSNDCNVLLHADPAFNMDPELVDVAFMDSKNKYVGVNLSNLVLQEGYGGDSNIIWQAYIKLIDLIFSLGYIPVLIPHVMSGSDYDVLQELKNRCKRNEIILVNENYNAAQLKYIISRCDLFVGARTHSTIAAYSSYIPTLVLGYSIKSIGIAEVLFGTSENFVVSVSEMENATELSEKFQWIFNNREDIRNKLQNFIPSYRETTDAFFRKIFKGE